jgi:Arc/MetJ family transcription regulator
MAKSAVVRCRAPTVSDRRRLDIYLIDSYILFGMAKRLVDIDDNLLEAAKAHFHTTTIKDTVNAALADAAGKRMTEVKAAMDTLAGFDFTEFNTDRGAAWS